MARPRKPSNVLELAGAFRKNPDRARARANEPRPDGPIGDPPDAMADDRKRCWREIVAEAPPGVLTSADRGLLMLMVPLRLHAELGDPFITDSGAVVEKVRTFDTKKQALLLRCYTELGMTPASRSKVSAAVKPPAEVNEFAV